MSPRFKIADNKRRIVDALKNLERYHIHIEESPGLIYEAEIDLREKRQYIKTHGEGFPTSEMLWFGEEGFGRRVESDSWNKLIGKPLPNYFESALFLIDNNIITSEQEENKNIIINITFELNSVSKETYRKLFKKIFEQFKMQNDVFLNKIIEISQEIKLIVRLLISKENYLIKEIQVQMLYLSNEVKLSIRLCEPQEEIPTLSEEEISAATLKIPSLVLQTLNLPSLGGWCRDNHIEWALRTIGLIETNDSPKKKYTEIYNPYWNKAYQNNACKIKNYNHPIAIGAHYEDEELVGIYEDPATKQKMNSFYHEWFKSDPNYSTNNPHYFTNNKYKRDHHHFGGGDFGLKYEWYFGVRPGGIPQATQPGGRYYSAKNWGYGGTKLAPQDADLNRLTFTEAIKQYNRYSLDGKRCAYLMLGHVLHLLQDQGMPDHAALYVHPASSYDEPSAFDEFYICYLVAGQIVLGLDPTFVLDVIGGNIGLLLAKVGLLFPIFGIAFLACKQSINSNEVGYEKFVIKKYSVKHQMNGKMLLEPAEAEDQIDLIGPLSKETYDQFFETVANQSIANLKDIRSKYPNEDLLDHPLGLSRLPIIYPIIPGCNPDIDLSNPNQTKPFFELTNKVIKDMVCYGAGLIKYFYEIVNHPPFVEKVCVVKGILGLKPIGFAKFDPALYLPNCKKCQVRYNAKWNHQPGSAKRTLTVNSKPFSPNHRAYIFIQFGPILDPCGPKIMEYDSVKVKLIGPSSTITSISLKLTQAEDPQLGIYYWGSFQPTNPLGKPYMLTLKIEAKDASAHFTGRNPQGNELDSQPDMVAKIDYTNSPDYPLTNYQPGVDSNHQIEMDPLIDVDHLEPNDSLYNTTETGLGFSQASLLYPDFKTKQNPDPGAAFYPDLTLHDSADADFFGVTFRSTPVDKNTGFGLKKEIFPGVTIESFPPMLNILGEERYGGCLRFELYDSKKTQTHVFNNKNSAVVFSPESYFNDKKFYLAVKNPDFAKQGKLRYGLFIRYLCGGFTVSGKPLYKLPWDYFFPFPWDKLYGFQFPWEVLGPKKIRICDPHELINFLKDIIPKFLDDLGIEDLKKRDVMQANKYYELGQIAQNVGLTNDAERLYTDSIHTYHKYNIRIQEIVTLRDLQTIYAVQGKINRVNKINKRIEELRKE